MSRVRIATLSMKGTRFQYSRRLGFGTGHQTTRRWHETEDAVKTKAATEHLFNAGTCCWSDPVPAGGEDVADELFFHKPRGSPAPPRCTNISASFR